MRKAMTKSISRYAEAYSKQIELDVKQEIGEKFKRKLEYYKYTNE